MLFRSAFYSMVCVCVCVCVCVFVSLPEDQCVGLHVQIALAGQKVQSEEAVVAPTFTNLKVRGKLPNYVFGRVTGGLMDHLHTVLIPTQNQDSIITQGNTRQKVRREVGLQTFLSL